MGLAFRTSAPGLPDSVIERPRLARRLDERWHRRLVTVVGGPGFGKTTALSMQTRVRPGPSDVDVWLTCAAGHSEEVVLLADLGAAFSLLRGASLDDIVAHVWMRAPDQVCFVLDDVHEIAGGSSGARLLDRLVHDLPGNGHVVLSSRSPVPIPVAWLAARRQLERVVETDLLFDDDELRHFAEVSGVEEEVLTSAHGWPALAALAARADDLVDEYVWNEVLASLGPERTRWLACLDAIGGADDEVLAAIASCVGSVGSVDRLVDGVPLVERKAGGWVALHPLWRPILRTVLSPTESAAVRRTAAAVHRDHQSLDAAIELYAAAEAWDDVVSTIRAATLDPARRTSGRVVGRWAARLPPSYRGHPVHRFAMALDAASRLPAGATPELAAAAEGFRAAGDVDGELAALNEYGFELWWANDIGALIGVIGRVRELADRGHAAAQFLMRIGEAGVAHINADSAGVLSALDDIDAHTVGVWTNGVQWLRHVAHRRTGDLDRAEVELDSMTDMASSADPQLRLARARTDWLRGRVDGAQAGIRTIVDHYVEVDNRYLRAEASLELASKLAWLGDADGSSALLAELEPQAQELPGALARILWLISAAALAVEAGDEVGAGALLAADEHCEPGRPDNWYWCDRCAVALPYVLVPGQRDGWTAIADAPAHRPGVALAEALVALRAGDSSVLRGLAWPDSGIARAHLPASWLAELVAASAAAGNPAPPALAAELGVEVRSAPQLQIRVLGPLTLHDGTGGLVHPDLRRQRVRELLGYLVVHRHVRREVVADALWPELADPRHNLRVTLNYLQRALGGCRPTASSDGFVEADRESIGIVESSVRCDLWDVDELLRTATRLERSGQPRAAIDAFDRALALWSGQLFDDVVGGDWIRDEQTRWRDRLCAAALRCGELHLAAGEVDAAVASSELAISNDPADEGAYQLLARSHLAKGDRARARRALGACTAALDDLGVGPADSTRRLIDQLTDR